MIDRAEFQTFPPEPVRLAWCVWLRWHGIDPYTVPVPGWIERREAQRQIVHEAYVFDEHGRLLLNEVRDDALREVRVVQLEAEPSPFPTVGGEMR